MYNGRKGLTQIVFIFAIANILFRACCVSMAVAKPIEITVPTNIKAEYKGSSIYIHCTSNLDDREHL